ncbi:histidine kinase [Actinosynnema sp. ALI-1.44]|uniref:HAMP domain-containing sensor histidine kinase n=1 Tax=Actinosynnema sp. ALI-1.44 TaxID=1933779 RepID=UPI00097BC46A|nr:HAMP domain-containing sensor histidine kinase [Actinosynnema sp. ALI-1.44]ONI89331.1 histidine kinase [Actinosynnema sp. ALI-1.44]
MTRRRSERKLLLRDRIGIITACVVAVAIVGVAAVTWLVTRQNLRDQLDQTLLDKPIPAVSLMNKAADRPTSLDVASLICKPPAQQQPLQQFLEGIQVLRADGSTCAPDGVDKVTTTLTDHAVTTQTVRNGETWSGVPVRVALRPVGNGDVIAISRALAPIDDVLTTLGSVLIVMCLVGACTAGAAGLLLARRALAPMRQLTTTAEHIARTEDLDTSVEVAGGDEIGRLGSAFSAMTTALRDSRRRQQELVTNAAHELSTPLTSLRTNVDLLVRSEHTRRAIPAGTRATILDRIQAQTAEFGTLVAELVELARDNHDLAHDDVAITTVIERAVHRATSRAPDHIFDLDIHADTVHWATVGDAAALETAVLNLLDNAVKFSPPHSTIAVRTGTHWLTITDQGPGIPQEHRQHVFDRFWRAPAARALPGSGLGLAIVANTITAHGGTVQFVDPPPGWGACVRIDLPPRP